MADERLLRRRLETEVAPRDPEPAHLRVAVPGAPLDALVDREPGDLDDVLDSSRSILGFSLLKSDPGRVG